MMRSYQVMPANLQLDLTMVDPHYPWHHHHQNMKLDLTMVDPHYPWQHHHFATEVMADSSSCESLLGLMWKMQGRKCSAHNE